MTEDNLKTEYLLEDSSHAVTLNLKLDDIDIVVKALKHYRDIQRWSLNSLHATEDEREQAEHDITAVDRILGRG